MTKCIWLYWSISKSGIKLGTQAVVFIFKYAFQIIHLWVIWTLDLDQQLILSDHKVFNFGKQLGTSNIKKIGREEQSQRSVVKKVASVRLGWSGTLRVTRSRNSVACQARSASLPGKLKREASSSKSTYTEISCCSNFVLYESYYFL